MSHFHAEYFQAPRIAVLRVQLRCCRRSPVEEVHQDRDRRKALEFCLLLEKTAMKARRNELTAAQGRKLIAEMVAISSGEQISEHTVRGWFEEWISNKKASVGGR